jgi:hypothetical protein
MISSRGVRTHLNASNVETLDGADIVNVDMIVRPYTWEVNGKGGVKAYLQSMYVIVEEDALERKYAEMYEALDRKKNSDKGQACRSLPSDPWLNDRRLCRRRTISAQRDPNSRKTSKAKEGQTRRPATKSPQYLETMKVFDLLLAAPKYGRVKTNKILVQCRISPSKTMGGLSERQRNEIVSLLRR